MKYGFLEIIVFNNGFVFILDKGKGFVNRLLIWGVNMMFSYFELNGYV